MSSKYFCDRCGKVIVNYPIVIHMGTRRDNPVDLCHECHSALEKWLKS